MAMSAKHLHFEEAFLPQAGKGIGEIPFPEILPDADMKPRGKVRANLLPGTGMPLSPLRITKRRKKN